MDVQNTPIKVHLDAARQYLEVAKTASDKNYYIQLAEQQLIMARTYC